MSLMQDVMAMPPRPDEAGLVPAGTNPQPMGGGEPQAPGAPDPSWIADAKGEMDDPAYEDMTDRALLAAFKVLSSPDLMKQQAELLQNPTGEAVGGFVFDVLTALQEKAGGKIQDEVMPAVLFGVLAAISEAGELPPPVVAEATQRAMLKFLIKSGANPQEVEAALGQMDFNALAQLAQQHGGDDVGPQ